METQRFRFQAALSDLSRSDIKAHKDEPEEVVRVVRDWLVQEAHARSTSSSKLYGFFNDFMAENYKRLVTEGFTKHDIKLLPTPELQAHMAKWIKARR
jgi:hypothetical protein